MSLVTGLVIGAAAIVLATLVIREFSKFGDRVKRRDCPVHIPTGMLSGSFRYGLLHIRDGDDQQGDLLNHTYWFERSPDGTELVALVASKGSPGFEYKCFADHPGVDFRTAKEILQAAGMKAVTRALGKENPERTWFLLPGEKILVTRGGNKNNFRYRY